MKEKNFMKRAQSRGHSRFARVLTMLAMLFIAATGAWAQTLNAVTHDVTFADGLTDWTADPTTAAEGETITLNYRVTNRQPKYIIVVASSSKYGDYFAGGEGSLLQIDNMELLYE